MKKVTKKSGVLSNYVQNLTRQQISSFYCKIVSKNSKKSKSKKSVVKKKSISRRLKGGRNSPKLAPTGKMNSITKPHAVNHTFDHTASAVYKEAPVNTCKMNLLKNIYALRNRNQMLDFAGSSCNPVKTHQKISQKSRQNFLNASKRLDAHLKNHECSESSTRNIPVPKATYSYLSKLKKAHQQNL